MAGVIQPRRDIVILAGILLYYDEGIGSAARARLKARAFEFQSFNIV
jgi:hypothetical protein